MNPSMTTYNACAGIWSVNADNPATANALPAKPV